MSAVTGRNEPCPCGSGRKYKRCCLQQPPLPPTDVATALPSSSSRFRFQPGSYGVPGGFLPSIACLRREPSGSWTYHFVLVTPDADPVEEDLASLEAGHHLLRAFQGRPAPEALADRLKAYGYHTLTDFQIARRGRNALAFKPAADASE